MKKTKKFRDHLEDDINSLSKPIKKKKKTHLGPKKKHFSKYSFDNYDEEE